MSRAEEFAKKEGFLAGPVHDTIVRAYEQAITDFKADAIDGVIFGSMYFRQKNISLVNLTIEQYDKLKGFGEHVKVVIL